MKPAILTILLFHLIECQITDKCNSENYRTYQWSRSTIKNVNPNGMELQIYCHIPSVTRYPVWKVWSSAQFLIECSGEVELYSGANETDIACQHKSKSNIWLQTSFNFWKSDSVSVNPLRKSCIGVLTKDNYDITLIIKVLDLKLVVLYFSSCILFLFAPQLSRNIVFYYGTGISVGLFASLLILAFVVGRIVPRKSIFYSLFISCFSVSAYLWNYLYDNLSSLLNHYHHYILLYITIVSLTSFAVCYYKGPISNPRVFKLIQWTIQLISILILFFSCQLRFVPIATTVVLMFFGYILRIKIPLPKFLYRLKYSLLPPKQRFLTEDEYRQQGFTETRKALEELREYCNSPDCNAWKTVSRLRSPSKFADWVENSSDHVTDDYDLDFYADEDDEEEEEGAENDHKYNSF